MTTTPPPMPVPVQRLNLGGFAYSHEQMQAGDAQWMERITELEAALTEVCGCFNAAESEGLAQALIETADTHLKDLVERRLMYAQAAARNALEQTK